MKMCFFISAVVFGVAVCQSESPNARVPQLDTDLRYGGHCVQEEKGGGPKRGRSSRFLPSNWRGGRNGDSGNKEFATPEEGPPDAKPSKTPQKSIELVYLKEIASVLSIPVSGDDMPDNIVFKIKQCIGPAERYRGEVLSEESFAECCAAIPTKKDTEIFKAYHTFIKKIAGKKILAIGD